MSQVRDVLIHLRLAVGELLARRWRNTLAQLKGALRRSLEAIAEPFRPNRVRCEFCDWTGSDYRTFVSGRQLRRALCPRCHSLERHRAFLPVFQLAAACVGRAPLHVLDIAPNRAFSEFCKARPADFDYLSVDLVSDLAMRHMDLEDLDLPDANYDVVVCLHVLDYLKDDRRGIAEIRRVLDDDGLALTQEVVDEARTSTIEWGKPGDERLGRIREYGRDFYERWMAGGFESQLIVLDGEQPVLFSTKTRNATHERVCAAVDRNPGLSRADPPRQATKGVA